MRAAPVALLALLGPDASTAIQSLSALGLNSATSLVAGATLGSMTHTFAEYPGLLVMVPAVAPPQAQPPALASKRSLA